MASDQCLPYRCYSEEKNDIVLPVPTRKVILTKAKMENGQSNGYDSNGHAGNGMANNGGNGDNGFYYDSEENIKPGMNE